MKRRDLFKGAAAMAIAPQLPMPPSILDEWRAAGFAEVLNGVERWNFIAGQWVKAGPSHPQDTNTDYVTVPYE